MIIANPIYDTVFKRMMENERVAKFFIGTLLEQEIETVEVQPQEFTYTDEGAGLAIFRLDFIATIKAEDGSFKKILIEIQKAKNQIDLMRFRRYLGEQYKKEDKVNAQKTTLPITTIYVLGFTLPDIETACIKVERNYKDLINKTIIEKKSDFVEKLTHDSFIVQVERITDRYQTRLDKLLSVFEQKNFADDNKITKQFSHPTDTEEVKILTDILHHSGTNLEERQRIEIEQEAWRTFYAMFEDQAGELIQKLAETEQELAGTKNELAGTKNELAGTKNELAGTKNELTDALKQLEELKRKFGEQ